MTVTKKTKISENDIYDARIILAATEFYVYDCATRKKIKLKTLAGAREAFKSRGERELVYAYNSLPTVQELPRQVPLTTKNLAALDHLQEQEKSKR